MKFVRTLAMIAGFVGIAAAQTGPGTIFYFGTHHYADQVPEPYPGGILAWYVVRAPVPASYYSIHNLLDIHSITVYRNGRALTAQGDTPEYGVFVISDPQSGGVAAVVILRDTPSTTDVIRVSFDYVQE